MKYIISYQKPHHHYIAIEFIVDDIKQNEIVIQLPSWRPGRYELANFAKNIQKWTAYDSKGNKLSSEKVTKDSWKVITKGLSQIHIKYNYYAFEMNAGSTYLDSEQLYVNPVNCCLYVPERIDEACQLELKVPADYQIAIGVDNKNEEEKKEALFVFNDFHELADTPFIASKSLQQKSFNIDTVEFNLWFQGECEPDWKKLTTDFSKFATEQMNMMKTFPVKKYHFLFQILPYKTYHGVEHTTSTVISLGPGYNLMNDKMYEDLLGVSCHELFHVWNVKSIRPIEMQPYDYSKENYSKLGYVCEGVTTYYGDYLLFRSGVYTEEQYLKTFNATVQRHVDNFGRFNLSVADSSFDTWLDGYTKGVPNRKTSIYNEGCLLAFVTDMFVREKSNNKHSLDDVMRYLYEEFGSKNIGYLDNDYKGVVEHFANTSFDTIFEDFINTATDYTSILTKALSYVGCELATTYSNSIHEHGIGVKVINEGGACKVVSVYPNSVADFAEISIDDEVIAVNDKQIDKSDTVGSFRGWCNYFSVKPNEDVVPLVLTMATKGNVKRLTLSPKANSFYKKVAIKKRLDATDEQKKNFEGWSKNKF